MAQTTEHYDVVIIGGGMAGATLACALAPQGLRVAVIEAHPINTDTQPSYDTRCIALAPASEQIYRAMGLWPLLAQRAQGIREIHVSEQGHFGSTRLCAKEQGLSALGWVIENQAMGQILWQACQQDENIHWYCPANLLSYQSQDSYTDVQISCEGENKTLRAALLIGADGAQSRVRQLSSIDCTEKDYGQTAIISTITPQYKHQQIAYERFTTSGPLALLPLSENRLSLVYTVNNGDVDDILAMDDAAFEAVLLQRVGHRLGHFPKMAPRKAYPLKLLQMQTLTSSRMALIGNAAHAIHPVAGQGFNLGMRDIAVLAELVVTAWRQQQDIGADSLLHDYEKQRHKDHRDTIAFTDGLIRTFSQDWFVLKHLRSKALGITHVLKPAKNKLARISMGYQNPQARMIRGLPL